MAKVVIIGGNKRSGKTTLATLMHKKYNFNYYNFDMLLDSLEASFSELNDGKDDKYIKLLEEMVKRSLDDAKNYNISTVYEYIFTPDMFSKFKYIKDVKIVFLANLDANEDNIEDDLIKYSKEYDWPLSATNEDMKRNIKYILENNEILKEECKKYNFRLINTSREKKRNTIINKLLKEFK